MTLTPRQFFGTNEMVCLFTSPVCVEGYNCSFFCGTLILLSEGVCPVLSMALGRGGHRISLLLKTSTTLSLRGWNGVTLSFLVLRVTTNTV